MMTRKVVSQPEFELRRSVRKCRNWIDRRRDYLSKAFNESTVSIEVLEREKDILNCMEHLCDEIERRKPTP